MREVLAFIWQNLDDYRKRYAFFLIISFVDGLVGFLLFVVLAEFTKSQFSIRHLINAMAALVIVFVISLLLQWVTRRYAEALSMQFANYLRGKLFRQFERLSVQRIGQHHSGYMLSLVNRISDETAGFLGMEILWGFTHICATLLLFFVFTARESLPLAGVNLLLLGIFLSAGWLLAQKTVVYARLVNTRRATLLQHFSDFMTNILTIKKLGIFSYAENKIEEHVAMSNAAIVSTQRFHARRWFILHAIFNIMVLGTFGFLLFLVAGGQIALSVLIIFVGALTNLGRQLTIMSELMKRIIELKAYIIDITTILFEPSKNATVGSMPSQWGRLAMRDIVFSHPDHHAAMRVPSFELARGEKVCITGRSGQGKTTFLNLFAKFYDPQGGERMVDDKSYDELRTEFFSSRMVMISQEVELFALSLLDNIILGNNTIDDNTIISVLEQVDLGVWVANLEHDLDTLVGEKGIKLSAGQKQRVNLVRGILLDRDIYLLDEPTSHLDADTEEKVVQFLEKRLKGKTAIIVSHRPAVQRLCSRIYTFRDHEMREIPHGRKP